MLRLILDRSGAHAGFALADEERILCAKTWEGGYASSPDWFAELSDTLAASGRRLDEVGQFVCAVGPGSFSGIRSALAALEGMALPGNKPVCGISSAAALAFEYGSDQRRTVSVIGDARRSRLWLASFVPDPARGLALADGSEVTQTASDFALIRAEEVAARVPDDALVLSPDFDRIGALLEDAFPRERLIPARVSSRASVIAGMAARYSSLCRLEPVPVYLHPAVAERN